MDKLPEIVIKAAKKWHTRFERNGVQYDDVLSSAMFGYVEATQIKKYKYSGQIYKRIVGRILDDLRTQFGKNFNHGFNSEFDESFMSKYEDPIEERVGLKLRIENEIKGLRNFRINNSNGMRILYGTHLFLIEYSIHGKISKYVQDSVANNCYIWAKRYIRKKYPKYVINVSVEDKNKTSQIKSLHLSGLTTRQISEELGLCISCINKYKKKHKLSRPNKGKNTYSDSKCLKFKIVELASIGMKTKQICKELGVSRQYVDRVKKKFGNYPLTTSRF